MDDLRAVMDAAGADCPALWGVSEGGPMSILFAATYPERVRSLILYGTLPRFTPEPPDYPWGFGPEQQAAFHDEIETDWGEGALATAFFGSIADVPGFREMYGRIQRASASPMMARMLWEAVAEIDVGPVLQTIRTPTLVLGRRGDVVAPPDAPARWQRPSPTPNFRNCLRDRTVCSTTRWHRPSSTSYAGPRRKSRANECSPR
jgi:pimeloyl-ACP methyl ester carboxylesterase